MAVQDFKDLLTQRPFEPFRVVMSSGEQYEVRHPEMTWLTRSTLYIGTGRMDGGVPDEARMCSLLHVANIEPANGKYRKRK